MRGPVVSREDATASLRDALREAGGKPAPRADVAQLAAALQAALEALYVTGAAPFRVPCAIDHDLWRFCRCETADDARATIASAIGRVVEWAAA